MTYPTKTDTIPIPSRHECTLFNSEDPDNGIFYDSSHVVKDIPHVTARVLTKSEAADRYCRWTPLVGPMESGLFTAMKEA